MATPAELSVSDAREHLATVIDQAREAHEPVHLTRHGRRVAAVIGTDDLERILELAEDMEDIRAAELARVEMQAADEAPVPWDEVKTELGLA